MVRFGILVATPVFLMDFLTKWIVINYLGPFGRGHEVTAFLNIVSVWNTGVSFGMLQSDSPLAPVMLSCLALVILVALFFWLRRVNSRLVAGALGLVIGGALGNTYDRLIFGSVFDFLDFHIADFHWPAFNFADLAIVMVVLVILLDGIFTRADREGNST